MQIPTPSPDPNIIIPQIIPVFGMLTGMVITGLLVIGPVGRAVGDVIRHLFGAHKKEAAALPGEMDELRERVDTLQQQVAELADRQEFAERMLAQVRKERQLPGAADVAR